MKIAVLGDIHGNHGALEAVLRDARERGARRFWCVGDVVGYGADPNACCELVRKLPGAAVAGNHDHACAGLIPLDGFSDRARVSALWTRRRLSPENRSWLRSLPLVAEPMKGVQLVHGSLDRPSEWNYLFPDADPTPHFARQTGRLCFVGHTHVPAVFAELGGVVYVSDPGAVPVRAGRRDEGDGQCRLRGGAPRRGPSAELRPLRHLDRGDRAEAGRTTRSASRGRTHARDEVMRNTISSTFFAPRRTSRVAHARIMRDRAQASPRP